jgi:predicted 3-demethylubiquinone-9 3-methyltransferase (glyoxalase superfamily)
MEKIVPHLWYDREAFEAAGLYTSTFEDSRIVSRTSIEGTPSGAVEMLTIVLSGQEFMMISAGPFFRFTPAISFLVACESKDEVRRKWARLHEGGKELMPLGSYPFSEEYSWLEDRYGLSWQLMYMGDRPWRRKMTPTLMFTRERCGKAEEAVLRYAGIFRDSRVTEILHYGPDEKPNTTGMIKHAGFVLEGQDFAAMDSALDLEAGFNEAVSFVVRCDSQEEIDRYWDDLSARPEAEQCGWLKDRYGVSWQIVPSIMDEMMGAGDAARRGRVTRALLNMKKLDIAGLKKAYAQD